LASRLPAPKRDSPQETPSLFHNRFNDGLGTRRPDCFPKCGFDLGGMDFFTTWACGIPSVEALCAFFRSRGLPSLITQLLLSRFFFALSSLLSVQLTADGTSRKCSSHISSRFFFSGLGLDHPSNSRPPSPPPNDTAVLRPFCRNNGFFFSQASDGIVPRIPLSMIAGTCQFFLDPLLFGRFSHVSALSLTRRPAVSILFPAPQVTCCHAFLAFFLLYHSHWYDRRSFYRSRTRYFRVSNSAPSLPSESVLFIVVMVRGFLPPALVCLIHFFAFRRC